MLTESEIRILSENKTSLFSVRGELLWRSPAWLEIGDQATVGRDEAGIRWQEYVAPDDLDYLLQWFAGLEAGEMGGHAVFRMLIPISRRWVCCIWSKERLRGDWLVVGETIEVTDLPVPTGVAEAISQAGEVAASDDEEMKENEEKTERGGGGGGGLILRGLEIAA